MAKHLKFVTVFFLLAYSLAEGAPTANEEQQDFYLEALENELANLQEARGLAYDEDGASPLEERAAASDNSMAAHAMEVRWNNPSIKRCQEACKSQHPPGPARSRCMQRCNNLERK